ncbi:hypothetical protein [Pseudoxanthomonas beigongshangi]
MAVSKKIVIVLVAALLIGASYWLFLRGDGSQIGEAGIAKEKELGQGAIASSGDGPRTATHSMPKLSSSVLLRYQCPPEVKDCERNPNVASTPEEAQWLLTHGYPTVNQIQDLRTRSMADCREQYLKTGSKVDQSLYGMSMAMNGEARNAIGLLSEGAGQGNVYAFHLLSDIYRRTEELGNLTTSAAYLRAAYLAGDSRAADRYAYQFEILTPPENLVADKEAFQLFKVFGHGRNYPRP